MEKPMMRPDDVCANAVERGVKIACRMLDDSTFLVEGDAEGLAFLGRLLLAQAAFERDCGFEIHPDCAGRTLFAAGSSVGIYIHRLPCADGPIEARALPPEADGG